uniref:aECM cysteine-cradle domain-containing protein n=1 Tax=Setaria digitata TaxID=48799 RepID=A0A915Q1M4_9BILA
MFARITVLLSLHITAFAEEKPFLDLKKVIRGALDVVAAVPTSAPVNYNFGDASKLAASNGIQGIDPTFREKLSKLFHIPPDFVHRLAAQAGFIDYEPTTMKPNYCNFVNSSQIIPNHIIPEQPITVTQTEQQAIIFQPVIKDGHLYYQPFGVLPQGGQPKMIIYGGRIYMATPLQSDTHAQQVTMSDSMLKQNSSEIYRKNENNKITNGTNGANGQMHYRRTNGEYMKTAQDVQIQTAKFQQVTQPDASPIEILGIESKATTSSPYHQVYKKELENYDPLKQFNLQNKPQEVNKNLAHEDIVGYNKEREVFNFQMTTLVTPYSQPVEKANVADKAENSNLVIHKLPFNQNYKQHERIDKLSTHKGNENQMANSQQIEKFISELPSREMIVKKENVEFMGKSQQPMQRILELRRRMAADRKKFAERKRLLTSMKRKVIKNDADGNIFRRHCYNIRSLAQQFGFSDIKQYVKSNCAFVENYYPEFKCGEGEASTDKCARLF